MRQQNGAAERLLGDESHTHTHTRAHTSTHTHTQAHALTQPDADTVRHKLVGSTGEPGVETAGHRASAATEPDKVRTGVFPVRWWILTLYSSIAFLQSTQWGIPGPISSSYESFYGMSSTIVQMLVNYGGVFYLPIALPIALWMDSGSSGKDGGSSGLRQAVRTGLGLVLLSSILRCFANDASVGSQVLVHLSFILNAIAGPVAMAGVSKISEDWFPTHERTFATAIMSEANALSFSQIIAPFIVTQTDRQHMDRLTYTMIALVAPFFLASLIYFPARPPLPPSVSAAHQKQHESSFNLAAFRKAVWRLVRDGQFWVLALSYGLTAGVYGTWSTVLSIDLSNLHETPEMIGLIGFVGNLVGNIAGVIMGSFADRFRNHKSIVVGAMAGGTLCFLLFTLVCMSDVFPSVMSTGTGGTISMFVLSAFGGMCVFGCVPLFFELAVDYAYPTPEATVVMLMTMMNNVGGLIFLAIPTGSAGTAWMNWFMTGACLAAMLAMAFLFRARSARYQLDIGAAVEEPDGSIVAQEDALVVGEEKISLMHGSSIA